MEIEEEDFGFQQKSVYNRKNASTYKLSKEEVEYIRTQQFIQPEDNRESDRIEEFIYRDDDFLGCDNDTGDSSKKVENGVIALLNSFARWFQAQYIYWFSRNRMDYRDARLKHEIKYWWKEERAVLLVFVIAIATIVYLFTYFEVHKHFVVTHMFVDSQKRIIVNPVLNPEHETIAFLDIVEIMEMDEWAENRRHIPKLNKSVLDAGFVEMDVYNQENRRNVSIELLVKTMESYVDDQSCISALNFGIVQNIILIKRREAGRDFTVTMYDPILDTLSYDKVTASIMKKVENDDGNVEEVVVKKIQVPKKIIVEFYDHDYGKLRLSLYGEESACVYQFIELYKTLAHKED